MNKVSNVPRSSSWARLVQYSRVLYSCARLSGCRHSPVVWCVTHVMSKALRMMRSDTSGSPVGWREPADGEPSRVAHGREREGVGQGMWEVSQGSGRWRERRSHHESLKYPLRPARTC